MLTSTLVNIFQSVKLIRGSFYFLNVEQLATISFLRGLVQVDSIYLLNNPNMIISGLTALTTIRGEVIVTGCDRLCPARYPAVNTAPALNDSNCPRPYSEIYMHFDGPASEADFPLINHIALLVTINVTVEAGVCVWNIEA